MSLVERIRNHEARIGVIGLGYVGLPLVVEFARTGFDAFGIDVAKAKIDQINSGKSYIPDVPSELLAEVVTSGKLRATTDFSVLANLDTVNICVPTPLRKTRDPDISYVVSAVEEVKKYLHRDQLIILESTTYPGTTEEVILPILVETGLKVGEDFYLAFSPERVDPGNKEYKTGDIPKVVGGITPNCTEVASELYRATSIETVAVSSANVAETVKLLENTFRSVNIGLVNEIALMCNKMGIDVWEVIEAAATKPFGFMPFYPGPGLGGHCIPIDPFYLSWKAKLSGFEARFIELAGQINGSMPEYVVSKIADGLNRLKKSVNGSRVLIVGVSYKADIDDIRESPALDVIRLLSYRGAEVLYHDRLVRDGHEELAGAERVSLTKEILSGVDCAAIITNHSNVEYGLVLEHVPVVVDTRNVYKNVKSDKIVRL
ncbi:MAG: nucleotide sugar dehydrogenase [Candidatus Krumholzibacteria bacterium]|nr:nucleotide sugar dehydrogenase [Candidatus Krumholzibacteria bacterium]